MLARWAGTIPLLIASTALAETWTETFETGLGRFNQTNGNGDTVYTHDAAENALDALFSSYPHAAASRGFRVAPFDAGRVAPFSSLVNHKGRLQSYLFFQHGSDGLGPDVQDHYRREMRA